MSEKGAGNKTKGRRGKEAAGVAMPPLMADAVQAGFPSPAEHYIERELDLNDYFSPNREAVYYVRVTGESMTGANIFPGDVLCVDRSLDFFDGAIIVVSVDGEFTVKYLRRTGEEIAALRPDGVRIYPTVILRDTPLYSLWRSGAYREHTVEDAVRVCAFLLETFASRGIPVLRLGLHCTESLRGAVAGGAWHPALGELARGAVWLERARALLRGCAPGTEAVLEVRGTDLSQLVGRRRCNLETLKAEFSLAGVCAVPAALPEGTLLALRKSAQL